MDALALQTTKILRNDRLRSASLQTAVDAAAAGIARARAKSRQALLGGPADLTFPMPVANQVLVGTADAHFTHMALSTPPITLAIADGGTGATMPAAARTNLGLGTASVANSGTASGNVPVIGGNDLLPATVFPTVTTANKGFPPAYGADGSTLLGPSSTRPLRWVDKPTGRVPLKEVSVSTSESLTIQGTSAWDSYQTFEVEILMNCPAGVAAYMRWDISGTFITTGVYSYRVRLHDLEGLAFDLANVSTGTEIRFTAATIPGDAAIESMMYRLYINNPRAVSGSNAGFRVRAQGKCDYVTSGNNKMGLARTLHASLSTDGFWRGLYLFLSGAGEFGTARVRIWGLTSPYPIG